MVLGWDDNGVHSVIVSNSLLEETGLTTDKLFSYAMKNTK